LRILAASPALLEWYFGGRSRSTGKGRKPYD
jgi:hypothetical protein